MSEPPQELPPAPAKGALELATALSVATRIEPELIRAVRLRLLPHLDTGAEADLWFSDWVGARTPEAIALLPECLPYLRAALVEKLEREPLMGRLFSVIAEYHRDLSPALFLEEQVTWHSLTGDREAVTEQLNRALHALVQQNRTGLAGWFAEAWTRLPAEARASAAAWSLATVTGAHNPSLRPGGAMELALDDIAAIASAVGETRLGVLREGSALLLGDVQGEHAAAILVPDTEPRVVEVVTGRRRRTVRITRDSVVRTEVGTGEVGIRTGTGQVYTVERAGRGTPPPAVIGPEGLNDLLDSGVDPERVPSLTAAVRDLIERFREDDDLPALSQAVDLGERLLNIGYGPATHPELGCEIAEAHYLDGLRFGRQRALRTAVRISQQILDTPRLRPSVRVHTVHGAALRELFSFSGQPEDLRQALHVLTAPLGSSSVLPGEKRRLLLEFLRTCVVLHMVEPRENVPETALEFVGRRGLAAGDEAFVALPLARIHLAWHRTTGSPGSLDRAQDLAERFDAPQQSRSDLAEQQAVLASVSLARFRMYGEPNLLLDTLVHSGSALSLVHREDRIRRPLLELAHAEVLRLQHSLTRDAANLEEATVLAGRAVSGLPRTAVWRQRALLEFARCRLDGFRLNGEPSELDQAVEAFQSAASAATADWQRADRHDALLQRAECLLLRYEAFGDGQALELAAAGLENAEQELSFDDAPQDVAHAAVFASTVLALHTADSTHSGHDRDRDFDRALTLLDFALESAQADVRQGGAARASALLARAALIHGMEEAPSQLLHDAARGVEQVCRDRAAPPLQRLRAAVVWGSLATRLNAGAEVMRSYEAVTELLPPVLLLPADVRDHAAPAWEKLSREAAASAIEAGMPERALEFLELRGVLLSAWREQSHGDVDRLSEVAPSLATELRWLWAFLHLHPERGQPLEHRRRERPQAQLEHLLDAVRAVPGFEDFLSPVPARRLLMAAGEGPVVVLSAAARRCDALLVTPRGVAALPLPAVRLADIRERVDRYQEATALAPQSAARRSERARATTDMLHWLWDVAVRPVLDALGLPGQRPAGHPAASDDALPRLWWCPTGPFSGLPFHAAGSTLDRAMDHAVHSYTPSVQALMSARRDEHYGDEPGVQRMLVVSPDGDLPHGAREVDLIRQLVPGTRFLGGEQATVSTVLALLPAHPFFHFTGHAGLRGGVPGMFLGDGEALTGRHMRRGIVSDGALAYLSACHTARYGEGPESGGWALAGSFQSAGYRHVIAVLDEVEDSVATRVTDAVYNELLGVDGRLHPERSARALHRTLRRLLSSSPRMVTALAGLIHLGP